MFGNFFILLSMVGFTIVYLNVKFQPVMQLLLCLTIINKHLNQDFKTTIIIIIVHYLKDI